MQGNELVQRTIEHHIVTITPSHHQCTTILRYNHKDNNKLELLHRLQTVPLITLKYSLQRKDKYCYIPLRRHRRGLSIGIYNQKVRKGLCRHTYGYSHSCTGSSGGTNLRKSAEEGPPNLGQQGREIMNKLLIEYNFTFKHLRSLMACSIPCLHRGCTTSNMTFIRTVL